MNIISIFHPSPGWAWFTTNPQDPGLEVPSRGQLTVTLWFRLVISSLSHFGALFGLVYLQ